MMSSASAPLPRVLVADGAPEMAETLRVLLSVWGFEARAFGDCAAALAESRSNRWWAAVIDAALPGSEDLARRLRVETGDAVLLIATYSGPDGADAVARQTAGFDHAIAKPIDPEELETLLLGAAAC
jgi:DNA-binding response OmpR family regulator